MHTPSAHCYRITARLPVEVELHGLKWRLEILRDKTGYWVCQTTSPLTKTIAIAESKAELETDLRFGCPVLAHSDLDHIFRRLMEIGIAEEVHSNTCGDRGEFGGEIA